MAIDELTHVLSVDPGAEDLHSDVLYDKVLVFATSSGLIQVDEGSSRVRLAHYMLDEHLRESSFATRMLAGLEKSLATACLTYLSFEPLRQVLATMQSLQLSGCVFTASLTTPHNIGTLTRVIIWMMKICSD